jgi:uncharacterized repeat protein (TIGR01451 family)
MTSPEKSAPQQVPPSELASLDQELQHIYADPEGKMPDFSRLDGKRRNRILTTIGWILFFLISLAGVSWAGFFFFLRPSAFTGDKVTVRIDAPESLTAGGDAVFTLVYRNDERIPVASAMISAELPKEFILTSADPVADQSGEWPIGSISPNQEGHVVLRGWIRKEPGATLTARATLTYKPADFNSSFQKVVSRTVPVSDSVIKVTGQGPDNLVPGDNAEFAFNLENTSTKTLDGLAFWYDQLNDFVYDSATPTPLANYTNRWKVPTLAPGAQTAIAVSGTFSSTARGPRSLHGRVGYADGDNLVAIADTDATTTVEKSDLSIGLIVNGSSQAPAVSLGDTLHFTVNWKNVGDVHLKDVTIATDLPTSPTGAELVDWPSLKDDLGGMRKDATLTWTSKQIPGLADLAPNDEGSLDFSVQLTNQVPANAGDGNLEVDALCRVEIGKSGKTAAREIVGSPLAIKLNSDTIFKADGRYFDESGAPLGSGPLPPQVGQKTTYRVFWTITNSLHELSNLTVTTLLPQGVKWSGTPRQVDAGELTFDDTGRVATWRLNRLPTSVKQVIVSFDAEVTPTAADVGNILNITSDSKFEALDKATNSVILKTEQPIGTDLIGDDTAAGKGVVKE